MKLPCLRTLLSTTLLLAAITVQTALADQWNDVGVRMGIQAGPKHAYFHQYEVFLQHDLPWEWRAVSGWGLGTRLEATLGALHGAGQTAFIGSTGPGISINKSGLGPSLDLGVHVDLLSQRKFGNQDFGTILQFGAYFGGSYRFKNGLRLEYRLQHISNGHILAQDMNPGLDLHMAGLSWSF